MTTYGFIGAGNMAGAIVRGAVSAGMLTGSQPDRILVTSAHDSARRLARETGVEPVEPTGELVRRSDVVVLAVKPHTVASVLASIRDELARRDPLLVSIAAGVGLGALEARAPEGARVVRAMPNVAASVGQSMTAITPGGRATEQDLEAVEALMGAVGRTMRLVENDMSAFIGLAGSAPAFVFTFIDALARAGVLGGLPKAQAVEIVTQAVLGSALIVQHEAALRADGGAGRTPADLTDAVCSPAGTTIAGLVAMEEAGFSASVIAAFKATVERDRQLGA